MTKISDNLSQIYDQRFRDRNDDRSILWKTLTKYYFQSFVNKEDTVIDLPAGYCEFINNIDCARKIAVDLNPSVKRMAAKGVKVYIARSTELPKELHGSADVVFVSNFFEHLHDHEELLKTLRQIRLCLKPGGKLIVLQPNIRLVKERYWDFLDHTLPLTEKSMREALVLTGFKIQIEKIRFLPYTTESRLPVSALLIRLYLKFPPIQWFLGKQSLFIAAIADN